MPSRFRSSGIWATPAIAISRGEPACSGFFSRTTVPESTSRKPVRASTSSVWPFPCTPATARISPLRTSKVALFTARLPASFSTFRPFTWRIGSATLDLERLTVSCTSRPTIISASLAAVAFFGVVSPATAPRRSTVILSATAITSFSLWVMKMTEVPPFARPRMISKSSSVSCGVSTADGSSSTRMSLLR